MLTFYTVDEGRLTPVPPDAARRDHAQLVWVDLFDPDETEEKTVEALFGAEIPTREEMHEIELSSRLYQENGALYATATLVTNADTNQPEIHAVTFILLQNCLVTVRYTDPRSFRVLRNRAEKIDAQHYRGNTVFVELLESIIDRVADVLENVGHAIDAMTREIFHRKAQMHRETGKVVKPDFESMLQQIGRHGDLVSKTRESLVSILRLGSYISQTAYYTPASQEHGRLTVLQRDVSALGDHASFLSGRINFLLDATLGMIGIEQNSVIKIFSVAAVMFLPPTLIASIYGMNFKYIPEFDTRWGFPVSLIAMLLSSYVPYKFFRRKGWL